MSKSRRLKYAFAGLVLLMALRCQSQSLWDLANENKGLLKIATLFTAQNVRDHLGTEQGINKAIEWCKKTGVTHVFIETFRSRYTSDRKTLEGAKSRFEAEGFEVSGCVTTTQVGKISTGWNLISCYTNKGTQKSLQEIFEYTASIFDEIWYDDFHNRGYEVSRETTDYDRIWVGTETRDYDDKRWGGKVQYEAYYIMRWLGGIGGPKTGGGWFDPYGTTENTYVEQARQTVLADAKEMLLFCYGSLLRDTGPVNVEKLRTEIPGLFKLAKLVRNKPIRGILASKPPNSDAYDEQYVYDFVGMLGLPLVPAAEIRSDVKAAFFPVHALKDPDFSRKLKKMLVAKKPVLITDGLAERLDGVNLDDENLTILKVNGNPRSLLKLTREQLKPMRDKLLAPFGISFDAPNKVALYLISEDCLIVENFNDEPVDVSVEFSKPVRAQKTLILPIDENVRFFTKGKKLNFIRITPRTLVAVKY